MNLQRNQPRAIWFTGLPCSGKTTLARLLLQELQFRDFPSVILDGDEIRKRINKDLGFSEKDRLENIRRVSEISFLFLENGLYTVNSFLTPSEKIREVVRSVIPKERLIEIYLNTPLQICEQRDNKGLYKKARKG
jgi:adenylylsulfate kinase